MRYLALNGIILAGLLFTLAGCMTAPVPETQPEPEKTDWVVAQEQRLRERQQRIDRLLALAEHALQQDRLMRPEEDSAYHWYQRVLAEDELNADAHWGMRRITQRYLELAEEAFRQGQSVRAEYMLQGAMQIAATPAQVQILRDRYRGELEDKVFALSRQGLNRRSESLRQKLADIARRARDAESRLLIVARSDAEGRWIYKQMREAVDGYRLRGNIERGKNPRIVLIDL